MLPCCVTGWAYDRVCQPVLAARAPPELAALTIADRLALSVLKMADATFKGYSGPGYTHMHGGGILLPGQSRDE